jgi:hypothetical protein
MSKLKDLFAKIFPGECIINGTSYSEKGKRFSLRPSPDEDVVLIKIDSKVNDPCQYFKEINPKCDLLCICTDKSLSFVFFVELKGSDVKHALEQIINTIKAFCSRSSQNIYHFDCQKLSLSHHGKIYGVIISIQKLTLKQTEKKRLHKQGIYIERFKPQEIKGWTCSQLLERFY